MVTCDVSTWLCWGTSRRLVTHTLAVSGGPGERALDTLHSLPMFSCSIPRLTINEAILLCHVLLPECFCLEDSWSWIEFSKTERQMKLSFKLWLFCIVFQWQESWLIRWCQFEAMNVFRCSHSYWTPFSIVSVSSLVVAIVWARFLFSGQP